ncbi:MAG: DNA-binding protein WhiA [Oscillospiraceae bacterium]|nr:DNA-binding protein WhiA [Oscillospiraceae bacterium]
MSFSGEVKRELSRLPPVCGACKKALLYGMFLVNRVSKSNLTLLHTEHRPVADCYVGLLTELTGSIVSLLINDYTGPRQKRSYTVGVEHKEDIERIGRFFEIDPNQSSRRLNRRFLKRDCCVHAFLRGVFMACGSVTNPEREYHLELAVGEPLLAQQIEELAEECGIPFRSTVRKGASILYLKESEPIEDMLTLMGAVNSSLELMNVKIFKDVRNKVNRVTNCETANIGKTVNAATAQVEQIRLIERTVGLKELPDDLRELAELRLENPEMSLRELCMELSEPISRSGVNHRLKRLGAFADEIQSRKK